MPQALPCGLLAGARPSQPPLLPPRTSGSHKACSGCEVSPESALLRTEGNSSGTEQAGVRACVRACMCVCARTRVRWGESGNSVGEQEGGRKLDSRCACGNHVLQSCLAARKQETATHGPVPGEGWPSQMCQEEGPTPGPRTVPRPILAAPAWAAPCPRGGWMAASQRPLVQ